MLLLIAVGVFAAGIIVLGRVVGDQPGQDLLARVPADLRGDCSQVATPAGIPASATLSCQHPSGQEVVISLFDISRAMDQAYGEIVRRAGVPRGSGDCAITTGAEHRYPAVGALTGRLLCYRQAGEASMVWTNDATRTVAGASRRDGNDGELHHFWTSLIRVPSFPTADERALRDIVEEPDCHRAPVGSLDAVPGVVAAIECEPVDPGANMVSYYRFANLDGLRRSYNSHVRDVGAPSGGPACEDGEAPGFLIENSWNRGSVTLGQLLCYSRPQGELVMEWTVDSLLIMGHAVGTDPKAIGEWWSDDSGPPTDAIVAAINAQASFPNPAERALLDHIPVASRVQCTRPSRELVSHDVRDPPAVAIVCTPRDGAGQALYYQFSDAATMATNYDDNVFLGPACDSGPPDFKGEAAYSRGMVTGRLGCATGDNGSPYLVWTHDQLNILAFAYYGDEPAELLSWWRAEAGPV